MEETNLYRGPKHFRMKSLSSLYREEEFFKYISSLNHIICLFVSLCYGGIMELNPTLIFFTQIHDVLKYEVLLRKLINNWHKVVLFVFPNIVIDYEYDLSLK